MSSEQQGVKVTTAVNPGGADEVLAPLDRIVRVRAAVGSWDGVRTEEHRFGGVAFRAGRRELGHLHTSIADLPLPRRVRDALIAAGRVRPHHVVPDSGWVTAPMRTAGEVERVIELFRWNYERAWPSFDR